MSETTGVRVWRDGKAGRVTLERPRAFNALTAAMVRIMDEALRMFAAEPAVRLVIVDAVEGRYFCAGGDVTELYRHVAAGDFARAKAHCLTEYRLDALVAAYPKPYVALMDGAVQGGGIGISALGSHPVATERTVVAMPECSVGLVPDSGATHLLALAPGRIGEYQALTGARMNAADAIFAGFASRLVPSEALPALGEALASSGYVEVIAEFERPAPASELASRQPEIDEIFAMTRVADIMTALSSAPGAGWRHEALKRMRRASPLSLTLALNAVRRQRAWPCVASALRMEYRLVSRSMQHGDFREGARAAVIDRDHDPKWLYPGVADVPEELIEDFFSRVDKEDLEHDPAEVNPRAGGCDQDARTARLHVPTEFRR